MSDAAPAKDSNAKLAIIAGSGRLPAQLVDACRNSGRPVFVLAFSDVTDPETYSDVPYAVVKLEKVGDAIAALRKAGITELVMAGKVRRPSLIGLRPDKTTARLLAHMGGSFLSGDNALFSSLIAFLEEEGFKIIGADDVMRDLLAPEGIMGRVKPSENSLADIKKGMRIAKELGRLDIGQAVVVENSYVLGVEAAEGTDAMLIRCANLKQEERAGVLVKAKKPRQEARVDLPAIGPATVENVYAAGLTGIAVEAGGSLILDKDQVVSRANKLGIFVMGVHHE
ncbi:MAG: LpxI family protein [Alphaproteobacteria bacterium]